MPTKDDEKSDNMQLAILEEQADATIRRAEINGEWYFSVIDVIAILTDSSAPQKYWNAMKARITEEGFIESSTKCRQLKLRAGDGKYYRTDAADVETLLRIIQSIPSPKAEPIKRWLARVGADIIEKSTPPVVDAPPQSSAIAVAWAQEKRLMVTYWAGPCGWRSWP